MQFSDVPQFLFNISGKEILFYHHNESITAPFILSYTNISRWLIDSNHSLYCSLFHSFKSQGTSWFREYHYFLRKQNNTVWQNAHKCMHEIIHNSVNNIKQLFIRIRTTSESLIRNSPNLLFLFVIENRYTILKSWNWCSLLFHLYSARMKRIVNRPHFWNVRKKTFNKLLMNIRILLLCFGYLSWNWNITFDSVRKKSSQWDEPINLRRFYCVL